MIEILHTDCMEYMKGLEDNSFDLAIVDPPYGIGNFSRGMSEKRSPLVGLPPRKDRSFDWNDEIPRESYFVELSRVSDRQIIWGANFYNCFSGGAVVWYKGGQTKTVSHAEIASLSFQNKVDYVHINWQPGFYREKFGAQIHPCQKPVNLYEHLLTTYAKEGDRILDTHLGSGSSAIAAHYGGFDFVGCEIDKDYYNAAQKRLDAETRQLAMEL